MTSSSSADATHQAIGARQWYFVFVMALVYLVSTLDRTIVAVMIEPIKAELGLNDQTMGLIVGFAFAVSYSLMLLPAGLLINRVNRRNLLAGVVFLWSLATALGFFAQGAVALLLCRLVVGGAEAGAMPTGMSMLADLFPAKRRATAIGLCTIGAGLGGALTGLVGGTIVHTYGWRAGFLVAAIPGILLAILIISTVGEPRRGAMDSTTMASAAQTPMPVRSVLRLALADRALFYCYLGSGLMILSLSATGSWFAPFLVREHGLDIGEAALLLAIVLGAGFGLGGIFGGPVSDYLARWHPAGRLFFCAALSLACIPISWAAVTVESIPTAVALFVLSSFLGYAFQGPALATVLNRLPAQARGGGTAIAQITSNLLGYGLGAYSVGLASDLVGGPHSLGYGLIIVQAIAFTLAMLAFCVSAARIANEPAD